MRVAVTCGGGFIGQQVVRDLRQHGITPVEVHRNIDCIDSIDSSNNIVQTDLHCLPNNPFYLMGEPDVIIHHLGRYPYPYPDHEPMAFWGTTANKKKFLNQGHGEIK